MCIRDRICTYQVFMYDWLMTAVFFLLYCHSPQVGSLPYIQPKNSSGMLKSAVIIFVAKPNPRDLKKSHAFTYYSIKWATTLLAVGVTSRNLETRRNNTFITFVRHPPRSFCLADIHRVEIKCRNRVFSSGLRVVVYPGTLLWHDPADDAIC